MIDIEKTCFEQSRWLVVTNYFMIFVYGAAIMILVAIILICYCPILIYKLQPVTEDLSHIPVSSHRNAILQRRNHVSFTNGLINALVHRKFHNQLNKMTECIICMEKFENDKSDITPLSHN
jgi:hypothetical protein